MTRLTASLSQVFKRRNWAERIASAARAYFASGVALLDDQDWGSQLQIDVQHVARNAREVQLSDRQLRK